MNGNGSSLEPAAPDMWIAIGVLGRRSDRRARR